MMLFMYCEEQESHQAETAGGRHTYGGFNGWWPHFFLTKYNTSIQTDVNQTNPPCNYKLGGSLVP